MTRASRSERTRAMGSTGVEAWVSRAVMGGDVHAVANPMIQRLVCDDALLTTCLTGHVCIVTGATSGHGKHLALQLVKQGAHVVAACRNLTAANALADQARTLSGSMEVMACDVASLSSVRAFAAECAKKFAAIHCLVNNAGVMLVPLGRTADGFETHLGTNYLGHFLLTLLLVPRRTLNPRSHVNVHGGAERSRVAPHRCRCSPRRAMGVSSTSRRATMTTHGLWG